MKLTILLFAISILQSTATTFSQTLLTLAIKDAPVTKLFGEIEEQTGFRFLYRNETVENKRITVEVKDLPIESVLQETLGKAKINYTILDNNLIVITPAENSNAQQAVITGVVNSQIDGKPLPGVNVVEKGTINGAITDSDGKFSISVSDPATSVLVFSFIGYYAQEIAVSGQSVINISLEEDIQKIDEVVVIGYGTAKKSDLSGATISVSGDNMKTTVAGTFEQALQGRAAGVTAVTTSGQPGSSVSIRVRGTGTINAQGAEPLYVVDGVVLQNVVMSGADIGLGDRLGNGQVSTFSALSSLNPSDILSMEILKDASACAIYGSQGANGVVLITTKKGKTGDAKFTYEYTYGFQNQPERLDVMNLKEYAELRNSFAAETQGLVTDDFLRDPSVLGDGTDWQEALFQNAAMYTHQLSAQGGTEKTRYYVSGSYFNQDGTIVGSKYNRTTARVNLDSDLKSWFKLGTNISFSRSYDRLGLNNSNEGILSRALNMTPDVPIYEADGVTFSGESRLGAPSVINPIGVAMNNSRELKRTNLNGNIYGDITLLKGLTFRTETGMDVAFNNAYYFDPTYVYGSASNDVNQSQHQYNQNIFTQHKDYLTYAKTIGKHNATLMGGFEFSVNTYERLRGYASSLPSNDIHEPGLGATNSHAVFSQLGSSSRASYYTRANYDYSNKYYLTYTFRYDGSSNFGPKNRWAPFHSFAVSWRISNEPFMENIKSTVSNLKLRAGWGQTGNDNIGAYRWGAVMSQMPTGLGSGYRQQNIANPYIEWEKQEQTNIGLDLGLLDNRIELTVDAYNKISKDFLMQMQLPSYMGTSGNVSSNIAAPYGNYGKIENKGIEVSLLTRPVVGTLSWDINMQVTVNRNKLIALNGPTAYLQGMGQFFDEVSVTRLGQPLYQFYGYKVAGIYQDKQDILNSPKDAISYPEDGNFTVGNSVWPGDIKFQDISGPEGVPDGIIDTYDRTEIGNPQPKFTYGLTNTLRYKNFEFIIFITGSYGNKILNYLDRSLTTMTSAWNNQLDEVVDRAIIEPIDPNKIYPYTDAYGNEITAYFQDIDNVRLSNPGTDVPRAISNDPNQNTRVSDRYIEDGSYLRFKNISLSYSLPSNIIKKVRIENLKLNVNLQNFWTITKYSGFDPEIGMSQTSINVMGLDNGRYPSPRIVSFGASITF